MHYYCHADSQQKGFHGVTTDSQKKGPPAPMVLLKGSLPWGCWKGLSHGVVERIAPMVLFIALYSYFSFISTLQSKSFEETMITACLGHANLIHSLSSSSFKSSMREGGHSSFFIIINATRERTSDWVRIQDLYSSTIVGIQPCEPLSRLRFSVPNTRCSSSRTLSDNACIISFGTLLTKTLYIYSI